MNRESINALLNKIERTESGLSGSPRLKQIVNRLVKDLFYAIDDLDIQPEEIWHAIDWFTSTGQTNEYGLVAAGIGLEHFLDLRMDDAELKAGITGGTPRTIEGPLYVAGAPESLSFATLESEPEAGAERLYMHGTVMDENGEVVEGALVEVWHCNLKGMYSYFDTSQAPFNLRRSIRTASDGQYEFKSFIPVGYSVPPGGNTDKLLTAIGRHGSRPAHIHFFVTAPGYRKLTTQINIEDDPLIWDDFAFATRDGLVPSIHRIGEEAAERDFQRTEAFASIQFNFTLHKENQHVFDSENSRSRVSLETA